MAMTSTGYGPRSRIIFDGDETKFELWEIKFKGYLRIQKLLSVIESDTPDADKNAEVFAELIECLDDRTLILIIRDAKDNGKKALEILKQHYIGKSKTRIIALYTELTSLKKENEENITDYLLRAETTATFLKNVDETISDGLLIAMIIKGLPEEYKTFSTVISQRDNVTFSDFKSSLRSFEETEKAKIPNSSNIMAANFKKTLKCYSCGMEGHKKINCRRKRN